MATTYIYRNASSSVTSDTTFTFSMWFKRGKVGTNETLFCHENESSHTQKLDLHLVDDQFRMGWYNGSSEFNLDTKMVFRDPNAWYHLVFRYDTTQSTASDRVRIYVNGVLQELETISGGDPTSQYPSQNITLNLGQKKMVYGRYQAASPSRYWCGSMSHLIHCDGQSYAPTEFGETDTTTGEWRIKDLSASDLTWGTNGHWLLKDGTSVTDASSNSNDFTVSGTLTKTEDCPSNVFATWNPLDRWVGGTFTGTNGNTTVRGSDSHNTRFGCTLAVTSGKYYWEVKAMGSVSHGGTGVGIASIPDTHTNSSSWFGNSSYALIFQTYQHSSNIVKMYVGGNTDNYTGNISVGDIVNFALDMDNSAFYVGINGSWINSGNPTSGSSKTGAVNTGTNANSFFGNMSGKTIMPVGNVQNTDYIQSNFGNGYFGSTQISSAGTNASGLGIFEYDVPSGYTALCTKGLNE